MAEIISFGSSKDSSIEKKRKRTTFREVWESFKSLDRFTKAQIIAILLIVIATPAIIGGYLIFRPSAQEINLETEVIGTMKVTIAEDFTHDPGYEYSVKTDDGKRVKLKNIDKNKALENAGAKVRIKGKKVRVPKDSNVLGDSTTSAQISQDTPTPEATVDLQFALATDPTVAVEPTTVEVLAPAPPEPAQKKIAVLLINFSNDVRTLTFADHTVVSPTAANNVLFANVNSVKNFYEEESRGSVRVTGQVFGYYTIPATNTSCNISTFASQAQSAAQAAGVDLSSYTNVVIAFPYLTNCGFAGVAGVRSSISWINDSFTMRTLAHELAHNFGVIHASSLNCTNNGTRTSFSGSCTYAEYGDPFTIMGSSTTNHNHYEMVGELGGLNSGEIQTVTASGTYTINPLLISPSGNTKLLKIARGNGTYLYIDFRAPFGTIFDKFLSSSPAVNGVTIRTSTEDAIPGGSTANSMLIDTNTSTTTFADAPLLVNKSITDPVGRITITTLSVNPGVSATVKIDMNSTVTPTPAVTPVPTTTPIPTATPRPTVTPTTTATPVATPTPLPTATPVPGKISFVKTVTSASVSKSGNNTMTISVPSPGVASGHKLIISASISTFAGVVSCKDSKGNTYAIDARTSANNLFVCSGNITTSLQLGDTITLTYPAFSGLSTASVNEFTGISSVKKYSQGASTSTKTVTVGSAITASSNTLLYGAVGSTYPFTPLTGFTQASFVSNLSTEYRVVNSGSYNILGTVSSGAWRSLLVGYW